MNLEIIGGVVVLIVGIVFMTFFSNKAVDRSIKLASELKVSPLIIGLVLVALGTDLPEIINSIVASSIGHADIELADSLGSVLTQMTLVIGLLPFLAGSFKVNKKEVLIIGTCEVITLILAISIAEKGYFTRINAFLLMATWPAFVLIIRNITKRREKKVAHSVKGNPSTYLRHLAVALLGFGGVAISSYAVIQSVIFLSSSLHVSEYFVSFFIMSLGTSLPELVVDLTALRKKQYKLVMGDAIGSCIVDGSISVGIGQFLFPQAVSGGIAFSTGLYTIFGSLVVILTLAFRGKVDRKAGALFITVYLLSYLFLRMA